MSIQIRNDINLITESIAINEAWQELPLEVREDLKTLVKELQRLDEAPLQPDQIQTVFSQMVTNRGEGGNTQQIAKKVQAQLTPLFAKITGNEKLKAILSKVGNAVPIDGIKKMVAKLPDPAGKAASNVVAQIQRGAQTIENDEDVAAFKGMMMLVITIGMGAAGVGGPAMLGVIGTAAVFRTVVDSAIKAAAGGTVADVGKTAAAGLAKGAIAGAVGLAIGELANELFPPEVSQSFMSADGTEIDFNQLEAYNVADVSELTPESAGELLKAQGAFEQMVKSSAMDGADFTDEQIEIIKQANQDLTDKIAGLGGQDQLEELSGLTGSDLEQITTARADITFADYEVQPNDNLSMIAYNNNVSVDDLVQANPDIEDLNALQPGQTIKIPPNLGTSPINPDDITDLDALGDPTPTYQGGVGAGDDAVDQAAIKTAQDQVGANAVDTSLDDGPLAADDPLASVQNVKNSLGQDPIPYSPESIDQLNLSPETEKILNAFKLNPENLKMDANAVGELMKRSGMTDEQAAEMLNAIGDSDVESTIELARSYAGPVDPNIDLDAPQGEFGTTDFDGDGKIDAIDKTVTTQGSLSAADLKQAGMNLDTIQELGPESMEVLNGLGLDPETLESVKQWVEIEKSLDVEKFMGQKIDAENIFSSEYGPVAQQALDDSGATVDSFAMKDASTLQSTIKISLPGMDRPLEGLAEYTIENNGAVMQTGVTLTSNPMGDWADSLTPEQADAIFGLKDLPSGLSDINTAVDTTAQNLLKAVAVPAGVIAVKSTDEAVKEIQKRVKDTKESFVHPQWKALLSEEIGPEFDAFAKEYGDEVAVYAMFEWYNRWIREHTIVLEGFEHLQEHRLVENIESLLKEAPGDEAQAQAPADQQGAEQQGGGGGIVRGIGKAFRKATGAIGKGVGAAVGGAVNVLVKPIINSAPVKGFLNKIQQAVGMQGALDPAKLQADYEGAGSPTDSDDVGKFLIKNAGATKSEVDAAFKGAGVEAQAPEETPDDDPTPPEGGDTPPKGPGGETPPEGGEEPKPGTQPQPGQPKPGEEPKPGEQPKPGEEPKPGEQPQGGTTGGTTGGQQPQGGQQSQGGAKGGAKPGKPKNPNIKKAPEEEKDAEGNLTGKRIGGLILDPETQTHYTYGNDGKLYPADAKGNVTDKTPLNPDGLQAKRIQGIFTPGVDVEIDPDTGERKQKVRGGGQVGNPDADNPELGPDGKPLGLIKKGMRAVKGAIGGGLATATRNDPNAGILQKGAAVTGALAGRALGGAIKVAGQAIGGLGAGFKGDDGKEQPGGTTQTPTPPKGPQGGDTPPKGPQPTPPVDKNKDGVDDKTGAEVDADGDGKNDVTKKPVKRKKTGGRQKGGLSDTDSAKYQRDRRAKLKQQQKDANKDGKDDATGQPIQQEPATAGQPNVGGKGAAQADAQADDIAARKDAVAQSKAQRGAITPQDHQLIRNDLAALAQTKDPKIARRIADKLSAYKDQGTDVSDYASSLNAVQKKVGIKGTAAKVARGMRSEAYQFMNSILESVNLTWQDIGYDVIILEEQTEYVYLIPAGLQRIRELAGV